MSTLGAPFLRLLFPRAQTPNPVLELEYLYPVNSNGRKLHRSIILHFLGMGEFVDAVMQDDFELGVRLFLCVLFSVGHKRLAVGWSSALLFGLVLTINLAVTS